ncbi:MAG: M20/M25/M40 family metallo-hydrolase [Gemmatimonadales bacterium]|nr:M20/M25/M40 family metallo-hydrolase [Gemmatimonadales bacterium]
MHRLALLFLVLAAGPARAQTVTIPDRHPAVRRALQLIEQAEPATIDEQVAICQVPAPPFKEQRRAEFYRTRMQALGLRNVRIDAEGNVIGERPGSAPNGPVVVLSGHLDTVFPEGTDVTVRREGKLLKGPGIEDNCRGLAVILAVVRALDAAQVKTDASLFFVATVGEEGPGNLRGVRHLFEKELKGRIGHFISVDGEALTFTRDAVGSYRYKVTFTGPGGHSFGAFGMPNPMHAMGRAIARIAELTVPEDPKTTFNVGLVEGGTSVNSIPASATFQMDMRSESAAALDALDAKFRAVVQQSLQDEMARWPKSDVKLAVALDKWGNRPAGAQPADGFIARAAMETGRVLGFTSSAQKSSTDANIPINLGIPAVTLGGGGSSTGAHSLGETWDSTDSHRGTQWALLLAVTLAGVR